MPAKCTCGPRFPQIGPKGCTFDGLPKKKRTKPKPVTKAPSKKRKYVTEVVIPTKRTRYVANVQSVLGKRKGSISDPSPGIFTRLRKRIRG